MTETVDKVYIQKVQREFMNGEYGDFDKLSIAGGKAGLSQTTLDDFTETGSVVLVEPNSVACEAVSDDAEDSAYGTAVLTLTADFDEADTVTIGSKVYLLQDTLTDVDGNVKIASVKATGILTNTADFVLDDTVVLNGKTYTGKDDLTDTDGFFKLASVKATGILTLTADLQDGDTVTLNGKAYTFEDTLTNVNGNVKIAATVQATAVLTNAGSVDVSDGDTVTIDSKVYTYQTTLTNVDGNVHIEPATVKATGALTLTSNTDDGDTVTCGTQVYTIQDVLTDSADNVQRGASASITIDNLIAAIMDTGVEGTNYGTGTTVNADMTAAVGPGDTMDVEAKVAGTVSNSIATTEVSAHMSWGLATLLGGVDEIDATLANLAAAIDLGAGSGSEYAAAMTELTSVTAVGGVNILTTTAVVPGTVSNAITNTEVAAELSWDNATMTGGVDDASGTIDNLIAAITGGAGSGTAYAAATTTHTTVTAAAGVGDTMDVTSILHGTVGNAYDTTETSGQASFSAAVLENGTDDVDGSLANLVAAVTLGAGSGSAYAASTTLHPTITAAEGAGDTIDFTAKTHGTAGNALTTTETSANASFGAAVLENGTDNPSGSIDNLIDAINLGAGAGTDYATSMTLHTGVTASAGAGDTMDIVDKVGLLTSATTETSSNASWAAVSLAQHTGTKRIDVHYLNSKFKLSEESVLMDGTTPVALASESDMDFIEWMHTTAVGSNGVAEGNIVINDVATSTIVYEKITAGGNQSLSCKFKIPVDKIGLIDHWHASGITKVIDVRLRATCERLSRDLMPGIFAFQDQVRLSDDTFDSNFEPPMFFPPLCVIKVSGMSSAATGDGAAAFKLLLRGL